jgi:hypothetical protein
MRWRLKRYKLQNTHNDGDKILLRDDKRHAQFAQLCYMHIKTVSIPYWILDLD